MAKPTPRINWRAERRRLEDRYTHQQGAVISISGGDSSAFSQFIDILTADITSSRAGNTCISLPHTFTQYDIIVELEDKLKIAHTPATVPGPPVNVSIASGNKIRGSSQVSNVRSEINLYQSSPYEASVSALAKTKRIIGTVRDMLRGGQRVALILRDWHNNTHPPTVAWFWEQFWELGLRELVEAGLLIICAYEIEDGESYHLTSRAPFPALSICLPPRLTGDSIDHALEDIANLFISEAKSPPGIASVRSRDLMALSRQEPSQIYTNLSLLRLRE
jgi:hypothetical protein